MYTPTVEDIKHAADTLRALSEGKQLLGFEQGPPSDARAIVNACLSGFRYTIKRPPTTRPFTAKEAEQLIGCVLVRPADGVGGVVYNIRNVNDEVAWTWNANPTLRQLHDERWHYRLPGSTKLKECWVTE